MSRSCSRPHLCLSYRFGRIRESILGGLPELASPHVATDLTNVYQRRKKIRGLVICGAGLGVAIGAKKSWGSRR
jgi:hypothetical protein